MIGLDPQVELSQTLFASALDPDPRAAWGAFLSGLATLCRAQGAWLTLQSAHGAQSWGASLALQDAGQLRPGRVYDQDELGLAQQARVLRVSTGREAQAWIGVWHRTDPLRATVSALLSQLDPLIARAAALSLTLAAERAEAAHTREALHRTGLWRFPVSVRGRAFRLPDGLAQALPGTDPDVPRFAPDGQMQIAGRSFADLAHTGGYVWTGGQMLISPLASATLHLPEHRMVTLRLTPDARALPAPIVARSLGLDPSETRLALQLADGLSLAEAGAANGWTVETTRSYSKRLYARSNTRGQGDLVRLIHSGAWWGLPDTGG